MEIATAKRGDLNYDLELKEGKIILSVDVTTKGVGGKIELSLEGDYFLDMLAAKIPGTIDDMIINALKGALK